jgi:hypothetical protein
MKAAIIGNLCKYCLDRKISVTNPKNITQRAMCTIFNTWAEPSALAHHLFLIHENLLKQIRRSSEKFAQLSDIYRIATKKVAKYQ